MDKGSKGKSAVISDTVVRLEGEGVNVTESYRDSAIWVRADGALCVGNECIVIKQEPGTINLDIEVSPTKCGEATADVLLERLLKTVGKGGNTRFTVKSDFVDDSSK